IRPLHERACLSRLQFPAVRGVPDPVVASRAAAALAALAAGRVDAWVKACHGLGAALRQAEALANVHRLAPHRALGANNDGPPQDADRAATSSTVRHVAS